MMHSLIPKEKGGYMSDSNYKDPAVVFDSQDEPTPRVGVAVNVNVITNANGIYNANINQNANLNANGNGNET